MTKDEVVKLGIASMHAQEVFRAHAMTNVQDDPQKRMEQIEAYERARADMHEAMNRHHAALGLLR